MSDEEPRAGSRTELCPPQHGEAEELRPGEGLGGDQSQAGGGHVQTRGTDEGLQGAGLLCYWCVFFMMLHLLFIVISIVLFLFLLLLLLLLLLMLLVLLLLLVLFERSSWKTQTNICIFCFML